MNSSNSILPFLHSFSEHASEQAIIWRGKYYSYQYLSDRIKHWSNELAYIEPGKIVILEGDFSPETVAILFALIEIEAIIVPLDIHYREKNEVKYTICQPDYLVRITEEEEVQVENTGDQSSKNELYRVIWERHVPGLVLFTSGSSGKPKAALHDFSKLLIKFQTKKHALRTVNFLLFDHWGGLNTLFHILSNNGTVIILEKRTPDYVCEMIEKYRVELLPASPTFLNMLLMSRAYERKSLDSLKIISYGAEPMPENLLKRVHAIFPNVKLQQTYGLIELGVMRSKSQSDDSLWVKIGGEGYETRVVNGILQIKSESAMIGYLNAESPFTEDGWFITGDAVEVQGEYFRILGRKSEIINVGGEKVFPQEVEGIIMELPFVEDVMVYGEANPLTGKIVCAKVKCNTNKTHAEIVKEIKTYCRMKLQPFKVPVKIDTTDVEFVSNRFKKVRVINN